MHTTLVVIKTNVSLYTHHFYNVIVMSESKKLARFLINEVELDVCHSIYIYDSKLLVPVVYFADPV